MHRCRRWSWVSGRGIRAQMDQGQHPTQSCKVSRHLYSVLATTLKCTHLSAEDSLNRVPEHHNDLGAWGYSSYSATTVRYVDPEESAFTSTPLIPAVHISPRPHTSGPQRADRRGQGRHQSTSTGRRPVPPRPTTGEVRWGRMCGTVVLSAQSWDRGRLHPQGRGERE